MPHVVCILGEGEPEAPEAEASEAGSDAESLASIDEMEDVLDVVLVAYCTIYDLACSNELIELAQRATPNRTRQRCNATWGCNSELELRRHY